MIQNSTFWVKINATLSKKTYLKNQCELSFYLILIMLIPNSSEKQLVFNKLYIFLNNESFRGPKMTQNSKFWVKINATVSKKKKVKYHCDVSFYPIFKILVSKFS